MSVDPLYNDSNAVPFAEVRPDGFVASNPGPSDTAMVFYPWLAFMARHVQNGELPLWTPLSGGGLPMMGNLSSALFFPATWLCFLPAVGVARGMFYAALFKLLVAGIGGYLLARCLRTSRVAALASGIGFMLFGYQVVWLNYSLANVSCLIPFCLLATERFRERPSPLRGMVLAGVLALQFLGGHAETSLAIGILVCSWVVHHDGWRGLVRLLPYGVLALMLCSFQLLPFVEYLARSTGRLERQELHSHQIARNGIELFSARGGALALTGLVAVATAFLLLRKERGGRFGGVALGCIAGAILGGAVVAWRLLGARPLCALLLDPDSYGNPARGTAYVGPEAYPDVNGGYVGIVLLSLALLFVVVAVDKARVRFCLSTMAFGLGFACFVEPLNGLLRELPLFDLAASTRMLPVFATGAILAGAFAIDEIRNGGSDRYRGAAVRVGCALPVALLLAIVPLPGAVKNPASDAAIEITSPHSGDRLTPLPDGKGGSQLVVDVVGRVDPQVAGARVRVRIGGVEFEAKPDATGVFQHRWDASKAEAGRYVLDAVCMAPDGGEHRSSSTDVEVSRPLAFDRFLAFLRIALGIGFVAAILVLRAPILWLVPVAIAIELVTFAVVYNPAEKIETIYPRTSVTDFLAQEAEKAMASGAGPFRVLCEDVILQPNMNHAYDLSVVRAYDQMQNARFDGLLKLLVGGTPFVRYDRDTVQFKNPYFDLFGLAYVVTGSPLPLEKLPGFELVFTGRDGRSRVYRNHGALPRAFLVPSAVDAREPLTSARKAELFAMDPRTHAFLNDVEPPVGLSGTGTVRFTQYDLNRVDLEIEASDRALLVLTDNDFPGWSAKVDSASVPILRTHNTFRAVEVPKGHSHVTFEYSPKSYRIGLLLAFIAMLVGGVAIRLGSDFSESKSS